MLLQIQAAGSSYFSNSHYILQMPAPFLTATFFASKTRPRTVRHAITYDSVTKIFCCRTSVPPVRNLMAPCKEPISVPHLGLVHRMCYRGVGLVEYRQIVPCCLLLPEQKTLPSQNAPTKLRLLDTTPKRYLK